MIEEGVGLETGGKMRVNVAGELKIFLTSWENSLLSIFKIRFQMYLITTLTSAPVEQALINKMLPKELILR